MARRTVRRNLRKAWEKVRKLFRRDEFGGEDPYAYVTAPRKPRPPHRSASAAVDLE